MDDLSRGVRSTASINGHPIHPMLVPFPIAFLVGALATDLTALGTGDPFWWVASKWLLAAGLVMGALAAMFGLVDFLTIPRARTGHAGWVHFLGNATALILALVNLLLRLGQHEPATGGELALSIIVVLILLVTGWLGGELAYRYKIGVVEEHAAGAGTGVTAADPAYAGNRPTDRPPYRGS
jgi:uncharacterized membrane protein